ncbi:hypothetical protein OGATHE_001612 [Ogataea polymorpha]|uniref:Signal recognition particle receptor subunit beta n=1 Tax=Ogataea polymorpha TaxID=460523 RepID=A0A9P8PNC0_9ASCO|nr:hypothetical protein OGATHE_001612 [Ogataea polymorpha]
MLPTLRKTTTTLRMHALVTTPPTSAQISTETTPLLDANTKQPALPSKLLLKIHDPSGQHKFQHLWTEIIANPQISLIIFLIDISDTLTIEEARTKLHEIILFNNKHRKLPMIVVCNKTDLVADYRYFVANKKTKNLKLNKPILGSNEDVMLDYLGIERHETKLLLEGHAELQFDFKLRLVSLKSAQTDLQHDLVSLLTKR